MNYSRGVRGAITLEENSKEALKNATVELLNEMISQNEINLKDIAFAIFTTTSDIDCDFPAKFARIECGFEQVPMMCYYEMNVKDSIKFCLRILLNINTTKTQEEIKHIYLKGAKKLRTDLSEQEN